MWFSFVAATSTVRPFDQAAKEGTTPVHLIDKYHATMKQDFEDLGMSFDIYHPHQ